MDENKVISKCSLEGLVETTCDGPVTQAWRLGDDELKLLKIRSKINLIVGVCQRHKLNYLDFYVVRQIKCCGPIYHHESPVSWVKEISFEMHLKSKQVERFQTPLIPGQKLCKRCATEVNTLLKNVELVEEPQAQLTQTSSSSSQSNPPVCDVKKVIMEAGSVYDVIMGPQPQPSTSRQDVSQDLFFESPESDVCDVDQVIREAGSIQNVIMGPSVAASQSRQDESQDLFADVETETKDSTSRPNSQLISSSLEDPTFAPSPRDAALTKLNKSIAVIGQPPFLKRKLPLKSYVVEKMEKIEEVFEDLLSAAGGAVPDKKFPEIFHQQTMAALKEKFTKSEDSSSKIGVLSVALASMSQRQVVQEFHEVGASEFMVRKTAQLVKEQGCIMPNVSARKGRPLSQEIVEEIQDFYQLDDFSSRLMPGMKDYVSVKKGGVRYHEQKRLVLCNLKELHRMYKEKYPHRNVGFSKFASLRPKHCVLAGSSGTHSVCVCKYHQNFKLLIEAVNLKQYAGLETFISYKELILHVICDQPTPDCYLKSGCPNCPGFESLKVLLKTTLEENFVDSITYNQWSSTDRCNLLTVTMERDDFVDTFIDQLKTLLPHHFIAKEQSKYFKTLKEELEDGEALVICDFAENYTCIIQDAVQSYYWENSQVTLHPFVVYFKENGSLQCLSFVIISDHMKHRVSSVYTFQKHLIKFLNEKIVGLKKVIYFSDGAAQQYKNKFNVININYHYEDFKVVAVWYFFGTSHGKGPCDGQAGALKRYAYLASLKKELIRNAREFFEWAKKNMTKIEVCFVSTEEVSSTEEWLKPRFAKALSIPDLRNQHAILSMGKAEVTTKVFALSPEGQFAPVELFRKIPALEDIDPENFVIVQRTPKKFDLGQVLYTDPESNEVLLNCFHQIGISLRWNSTLSTDEKSVELDKILALVKPLLSNKIYGLSNDDATRVKWQSASIQMK